MAESSPDRYQQFLRAFTTHEPAVRAFVRRLLPSRGDVDDVLQEVAIVLWEKFEEFDADSDFRAWACGIARFKALAWLRDEGRNKLVLDNDVVQLIAQDSLRDEPRLQRQRDALENCLNKVTSPERELLVQAYQPGVRIQDVATTSGRSVGGFYQWLYRMRKMLLECIQGTLGREIES